MRALRDGCAVFLFNVADFPACESHFHVFVVVDFLDSHLGEPRWLPECGSYLVLCLAYRDCRRRHIRGWRWRSDRRHRRWRRRWRRCSSLRLLTTLAALVTLSAF